MKYIFSILHLEKYKLYSFHAVIHGFYTIFTVEMASISYPSISDTRTQFGVSIFNGFAHMVKIFLS